MQKVHFVTHEIFEGTGAFETWAKSKGYDCTFSRVYLNEELPKTVDDIDLLIVLGGPQNPGTTIEECSHFNAEAEINLIRQSIDNNKIIIGVCLGAQLVGEALGAPFEQSPHKEIGVFPIYLTEDGKKDKKFTHFKNIEFIGHWHGDMPGLTDEAKIIAYSEGCPRQIVKYSDFVYGFQCHLEFNRELIELLIANCENKLNVHINAKYIQSPEQLRSNDYNYMNKLLYGFLDNLTKEYIKRNST